MTCPNCGNNLENNAKFCTKCGVSIIIQQSSEQSPQISTPQLDSHTSASKNNTYKILNVVIASVFIIIIIVLSLGNKSSNDETEDWAQMYEDLSTDYDVLYLEYQSVINQYNDLAERYNNLSGQNGVSSWLGEIFK